MKNIFKFIVFFVFSLSSSIINAQSNCSELYGCPDVCDRNNLTQEEFSDCEFRINPNKYVPRQDKTQIDAWDNNEINKYKETDWSEGYDIDAVEKAKKERKKQIQIDKQKRFAELKNKRENKGKWGINFSMTRSEVEKCQKNSICPNDLIIKYQKVEGKEFVNSFEKDFGKYSLEKYTKLLAKLNIRYKSVLNIDDFELEQLPSSKIPSKNVMYNAFSSVLHVFENNKKSDAPKYIVLQVTNNKPALGKNRIAVIYETENWGKNLLSQVNEKKSREKQYMDDL